MSESLFCSMDSAAIALSISRAQQSVCYAAPGIQKEPADAMAGVARRIGPELIIVCLDFDERVMRMGFGDLIAVKPLRDAGIVVRSTLGLRTGLVIVDNNGSFSPRPRSISKPTDGHPKHPTHCAYLATKSQKPSRA
jgi:hypothetical protein